MLLFLLFLRLPGLILLALLIFLCLLVLFVMGLVLLVFGLILLVPGCILLLFSLVLRLLFLGLLLVFHLLVLRVPILILRMLIGFGCLRLRFFRRGFLMFCRFGIILMPVLLGSGRNGGHQRQQKCDKEGCECFQSTSVGVDRCLAVALAVGFHNDLFVPVHFQTS